jgi:hypothetical protein
MLMHELRTSIQVTSLARYRKLHQRNQEQNSVKIVSSSSNAHREFIHPSVLPTVLLLVVVHLLLDLLNQTLLLLVLRSRRTGSDASLLVLVSNTARSTDARSISSTDIARSVGARLGRQVRSRGQRAGVRLHALALDVSVLADLLAACGRDGVGVDAVVAAFLGGLEGRVGVVGFGRGD